MFVILCLLRCCFTNQLVVDRQFLVSVLISIYNTEKYLRDCFVSVIHQTLNFQNNIQLILINDGSTDNSDAICLEYLQRYPDNIVYLRQEQNKGVSTARNLGLSYVKAKYVNMLDSDDKWDPDSLQQLYSFFEKHYNEIDVVSGRLKFFEAKNSYHPLDYKFRYTQVVDLRKQYDYVQLSAPSSLIKASAIRGLTFSPDIQIVEDFRFINCILLQKCRLGVVREAVYYYRKRLSGSSSIQQSRTLQSYYNVTPIFCYQYLFNYSKSLFGKVERFIQFSVMYDLQWRVLDYPTNLLTPPELKKYRAIISQLLQEVEDQIIWQQRNINEVVKIACLSEKYGYDIRNHLSLMNNKLMFGNLVVFDPVRTHKVIVWSFLTIQNGFLTIEKIIVGFSITFITTLFCTIHSGLNQPITHIQHTIYIRYLGAVRKDKL